MGPELSGYGYVDDVRAVRQPPRMTTAGNRIDYARGDLAVADTDQSALSAHLELTTRSQKDRQQRTEGLVLAESKIDAVRTGD